MCYNKPGRLWQLRFDWTRLSSLEANQMHQNNGTNEAINQIYDSHCREKLEPNRSVYWKYKTLWKWSTGSGTKAPVSQQIHRTQFLSRSVAGQEHIPQGGHIRAICSPDFHVYGCIVKRKIRVWNGFICVPTRRITDSSWILLTTKNPDNQKRLDKVNISF